jgi:hypothetical protein
MIKKAELIKWFEENQLEVGELSYKEMYAIYKEKTKQVEVEVVIDNRSELDKLRDELKPKIKELMDSLKGRTSATHAELKYMFEMYNAYYLRRDSYNCSVCVSRVYSIFKGLVK